MLLKYVQLDRQNNVVDVVVVWILDVVSKFKSKLKI